MKNVEQLHQRNNMNAFLTAYKNTWYLDEDGEPTENENRTKEMEM